MRATPSACLESDADEIGVVMPNRGNKRVQRKEEESTDTYTHHITGEKQQEVRVGGSRRKNAHPPSQQKRLGSQAYCTSSTTAMCRTGVQ